MGTGGMWLGFGKGGWWAGGNVLCRVFNVAEVNCLDAHCKGQEGEEGDGGDEVHFDRRLLVGV